MRKKIGKRIGPVPITLVAVFALAALLSAGLLVLNSGGAQAQTATGTLPDVTLDVGQGLDDTNLADDTGDNAGIDDAIFTLSEPGDATAEPVVLPTNRAFPVGSTGFTIASDQDDPSSANDLEDAGDPNGQIETNASGDDSAGKIQITAQGVITVPQAFINDQDLADQADNTARITVTAMSDGNTLTVRFNLTVVQDPLKADGVPATNLSPASGACEVVSNGTTLTSRAAPIPATFDTNNTAIQVSGGACSTAGESVDVTFKRAGDTTPPEDDDDIEATHIVYVSGGSELTKVRPRVGKSGLDEHVIQLKASNAIAYEDQTINVAKSMADDDGQVYLIGYGHETANTNKLTASSTAFRNNAEFAVVVQFVDGPARAFDANRTDKTLTYTDDDDDVDGSTLTVPNNYKRMGAGDENKDGYDDGTYLIPDNDNSEVAVTATIRDAKGRDVSGGDKDSRVDFNVMYTAGSDLNANAKDFDSSVEVKKGENTAALDVSGWKANENAVKVTVSAIFTGPTAPDGLDLGTITLTRVAEIASTADFATYSCVMKTGASASKGCALNYTASADTRFGWEEHFVVHGQFNDSLGSKVDRNPRIEITGDAADALETVGSADGYSASASAGSHLVMVTEDAAFGDYTITITNGRSDDDEVSQELTITVAGPPMEFTVEPMETHIPLRSRATFTVTAMDEMGGAPAFTTSGAGRNDVVQIDAPYGDVRGAMVDSDDVLSLNTETGMGTFTYTLPRDAQQGEVFSIFIGQGEMQVEVMVTAGMEPTAPGMAMNVMAEATSHDMITVTWDSPASDGLSDITGYMVQRGTMDDMGEMMWEDVDPAHTGMDMMYMDMGLMAETTYYYRVAAMNSVGMGEYSDGMAMAMTMMMPPMELGAPSITDVMSDAEGMATVMLMPGDNATKHYIWAQPTDLSQGMYSDEAAGDATMVTFSGLTSDMNYWFIAVAGRGTGADSEWSDWSGWSAETPIQ